MKELKKREEIDKEFLWDLSQIFKNDSEFSDNLTELKSLYPKISDYQGKLTENPDNLLECLKLHSKISQKYAVIYLYCMLSADIDLSQSNHLVRLENIKNLGSEIAGLSSFIEPEILTIDENSLGSWMKREDFKNFQKPLQDLIRLKSHTLSQKEEKIIAMSQTPTSAVRSAFSVLNNSELPFETIKGPDNEPIKISHGRYQEAMHSKNREYRKTFYESYFKSFVNFKNTFWQLFNGNIQSHIFYAKVKNFENCLEASLKPNFIPTSVYYNLINSVKQGLKPLDRWVKIRKKITGYAEIFPYDLNFELHSTDEKKYTYTTAKEIILKALQPLGEEYQQLLIKTFKNRQIDVYETPNKRSGGYSASQYGAPAFILLNWMNQLEDVFTLAHELGHHLHSHYSQNYQPYETSDYPIFLAEIASTVNEALLLDYLIKQADSKLEKINLIEKFIQNTINTFYRQALFAEFELKVHEKFENGAPMSADELCEYYLKLNQEYWGESLTLLENTGITWARIPHFYYNFYVYQYATGFAASQMIANKIIDEQGEQNEQKYYQNYINYFLKAGSSKNPIDILKDIHINMEESEPIKSVIQKMDELLTLYEKLTHEL